MEIGAGYKCDDSYVCLDRLFTRNDFKDVYEDGFIESYPALVNPNGNSKIICIDVSCREEIKEILQIVGRNDNIEDGYMLCLSMCWNFPRKECLRETLGYNMSGFIWDTLKDVKVHGCDMQIGEDVGDKIIDYINNKKKQ